MAKIDVFTKNYLSEGQKALRTRAEQQDRHLGQLFTVTYV